MSAFTAAQHAIALIFDTHGHLVDYVRKPQGEYDVTTSTVAAIGVQGRVSMRAMDETTQTLPLAAQIATALNPNVSVAKRLLSIPASGCVLSGQAFAPNVGDVVEIPAQSIRTSPTDYDAFVVTKVEPRTVGSEAISYLLYLE